METHALSELRFDIRLKSVVILSRKPQTSQFQVGEKNTKFGENFAETIRDLTVINNALNKKTQQMLRTFRRENVSIHSPMTKSDKSPVTRDSLLARSEIEGFCQIEACFMIGQ